MQQFESVYRRIAPYTLLDQGRARVVWDSALLAKDVPGCFAEFGATAGGISFMLQILGCEFGKTTYAFDSWAGAPEGSKHEKLHVLPGAYSEVTFEMYDENRKACKVDDRFFTYKGLFEDTLAALEPNVKFAFAFVDCDLGKSTQHVIDGLKGHVSPGGVLLFDEYLKIDMGQEKVVNDFAEELGLEVETRFGHPHQGRLTLPAGW